VRGRGELLLGKPRPTAGERRIYRSAYRAVLAIELVDQRHSATGRTRSTIMTSPTSAAVIPKT